MTSGSTWSIGTVNITPPPNALAIANILFDVSGFAKDLLSNDVTIRMGRIPQRWLKIVISLSL